MNWGVTIHRDGQPMTGVVPCDDWTVAPVLAEVTVGWLGGPVSVASAVISAQPPRACEPTLFDQPEDADV